MLFVYNTVTKISYGCSVCFSRNFIRNLSFSRIVLNKNSSKKDDRGSVCETPPVTVNKSEDLLKYGVPIPASLTPLSKQYLMLSKIRLTGLVVMTAMSGYAMAPGPFELSTVMCCCAGTGLLSGAANAINQFHEVPFDAQMSRTRNRLLVRSVISPLHAVGFATGSVAVGTSLLYFGCNGLTAFLGLTNLVLYTSVYTPLKRVSILNTWVGAIVGALPPMMGWAGCTGDLEAGAWIMAAILYAWQFPHFNALSWNLRPDYSRAGYRMMAVTDPALCRRTTLRYTVAILLLSTAAPLVNLTNYLFALESLPLNAYFTLLAWRFYKHSDSSTSRKLFRFSLIHLPALMLLMLFNKKKPAEVKSVESDKDIE